MKRKELTKTFMMINQICWQGKSQLILGVFNHQYLQMFGLKLNKFG